MEEKIVNTKKYDFYIDFCEEDMPYAMRLASILAENNLSYFVLNKRSDLEGAFFAEMKLTLRNANAFIVLLSNNFLSSTACRLELEEIIKSAQGVDREIMAVCLKNTEFNKSDPQVNFLMTRFGLTFVDDLNFRKEIENLATLYKNKVVKKVLYEKLNSYIASNSDKEIFKTVKEICAVLPRDFDLTTKYYNESEYLEYASLIKVLDKRSVYNDSSKDVLNAFDRALSSFNVISKAKITKDYGDILLSNLTIYLFVTIKQFDLKDEFMAIVSDDRATHGDMYRRLPHLDILKSVFLNMRGRSNNSLENVSMQVKILMKEVEELLDNRYGSPSYVNGNKNQNQLLYTVYVDSEKAGAPKDIEKDKAVDELENQLFEVAKHINRGNEIFQRIADKEATHEFLVCLKTSYERLKNYCELVGCKKVTNYCIDKLGKINLSLLELKEEEENKEGLKENCFKALLGFTLPSSGRYDVFISYKHEDDDIASNVHAFLKQNLVNAFYDKVTLPKLGKSEYYDAIMESLDHSENFVVILSNLQYIYSDWVKLEMNTFHTEMSEGRKPDANFIIIATPEVYDEIISSNKMVLPIQYRRCEIMKTTEYRERLLSYISVVK